jgi:hypothetical protein
MTELWLIADTSVFAAVDEAFAAMCDGPDPVGLNCTPYTEHGLPAGFVSLRALRHWMLEHRGAYAARNAIWRDLLMRARQEPAWMTASIAMALPALVRAAGHIARGHSSGHDDIDAEMLTAFIGAAGDIDLDGEGLYAKLRWHAVRAGLAVRNEDQPYELVADVEQISGAAPQLPYGHPDLIVARAVAADIIEAADAELIMLTRLDRSPLAAVAARAGIDTAVARMRRLRAERALVEAVRGGLLSGAISADSRRRIGKQAVTRGAVRAVFAT